MHSLFHSILDLVIDEQSPDEDERVALSFLRGNPGSENNSSSDSESDSSDHRPPRRHKFLPSRHRFLSSGVYLIYIIYHMADVVT